MITGQVPFTGTQNYTVFPKINNREIEWPTTMEMDPQCRDIIDKLIVIDPSKRLGANGSMDKLKQHPFFTGVNFSGDMTKLGLRKTIRETEPMEIR